MSAISDFFIIVMVLGIGIYLGDPVPPEFSIKALEGSVITTEVMQQSEKIRGQVRPTIYRMAMLYDEE